MISTTFVGISLVALLADRIFFVRLIGAVEESSVRLSRSWRVPIAAFLLLTAAAAATWALSSLLLIPLGVSFLNPLVFVAFLLFTAAICEGASISRLSIEVSHRIFGRGLVSAAILGLTVLFPFDGTTASNGFGAAGGVFVGGVYLLTALLYNGAREKLCLAGSEPSVAKEFVLAGLLALTLTGIAGIPPFN